MSDFMFINSESGVQVDEMGDYIDVAWDYSNNKPLFKGGEPVLVAGVEAVKSWAYRALKTRRYAQIQNSWDYGNDLWALIGSPWLPETKAAEAERYVMECVMQNPYVSGITDFVAEFADDVAHISFGLNTVYGNTNVNIEGV